MLVTPDELATYADQVFTNRQEDAASMILLGLQGELEAWLRRPIEPVTVTDETHVIPENFGIGGTSQWYSTTTVGDTVEELIPVYPVGPFSLPLTWTPINSITNVKVNGTAASVGVDYVCRAWGLDLYSVNRNDTVTVTYQGGFAASTMPINFFKLLILRAASREIQTMADDVVGLKEINTQHVVPATPGFTEAELFSCRKWRRKQLT